MEANKATLVAYHQDYSEVYIRDFAPDTKTHWYVTAIGWNTGKVCDSPREAIDAAMLRPNA